MGRINHDGISTSVYQCLHTIEGISGHTNTCSHTQTALIILTSHGLILSLGDVLIGDQTNQTIILIHHGQFFDLVLLQNLGSSNQVCLLMGGHKVLLRHNLCHRTIETTLETQVTVGDDTNEMVVIIHHGDTTNMILRHDVEGLSHRRTLWDGDRIVDHTILSTLDDSHLTSLILDRHVLVDHTNTTFTGNGDSHLRLRYRVHSGCHERNVQLDVAGEARFQLYCLGQYFRISWN